MNLKNEDLKLLEEINIGLYREAILTSQNDKLLALILRLKSERAELAQKALKSITEKRKINKHYGGH